MEKNKIIFQKERLYNYVKKFCFPRLAGTDNEKEAVKLALETFKEIGFSESQIKKREFEFSDFYSTSLIKLLMVLNLIFNLILLLLFYIHVLLTIAVIAIMAIIVSLIFRGLRYPEKRGFWGEYFGNIYNATNVIVRIHPKKLTEEQAGNIIISAHLDSKSQTYKTFWRINFYRLWLYSGLFQGLFYIIFILNVFSIINIDSRFIVYGSWISVILISLSNILLMFLNTHNNSPGALDNASGMAIVFELSRFFRKNPLNNFNIWFCQFSAEELGTMGSRFFVDEHESEFVKGRIFQFNFDIISCANHRLNQIEYFKSYGIFPRKKIAPLLSKYIHLVADKENIKINGFHLSTGAHTDSVPFHLRDYDAIDITTRAGALYTHSEDDSLDKVDPEILLQTCTLFKKVVLMMDKDYYNLCVN
ncbi:MAG: M28 family peptidase [Promethearchaeota archaeon]|nr:MAG: M28 family peptidase [Candidatus Lokiarchaeota archaeon]